MGVRVMADVVAALENFRGDAGKTLRALANEKESRARTVAVEQVEYPGRVFLIGTVIDRQPNLGARRLEAGEYAAQALRRRDKNMVQHDQVRPEKRRH